ncbi:MAG: molybdopterin-dependent oxidoreductase [Candidatus Neomarinimicrobiota bacterium]
MSDQGKKDHKLISRRDFLRLGGLAAGGIAAGQLLLPELLAVPNRLLDDLQNGPGQETWVNTVCGQCTAGCGLSVRRIDGVPVYVKGNPLYPVNSGGVCPMAHTSMELLFNPDRVTGPLKRAGKRSANKWVDTDWQTELSGLAARIRRLVARGEGHRVALINGDNSPLVRQLADRLMQAINSPNYFEDERLRENTVGVELTQGLAKTPAYDLLNSRYVISFGANFLEEGLHPVYYQNIFGQLRAPDRKHEFTLMQVDSRLSMTTANADRWIPIRPGTYGALALGLAHILIAERLYNEDFLFEHTTGFWPYNDAEGREQPGFEAFLRANYYPEQVSQMTGVPTATILQLGEDLGTYRPAMALAGDAAEYATNGGFTLWAVHVLNALLGNFQQEGGLQFPRDTLDFSFKPPPAPNQASSESAPRKVGSRSETRALLGAVNLENFISEVLASESGLIDTLIIIDSNPVYNSLDREAFIKALNRIDNVVCSGLFIDETALQADLILPDHSFLEKTDLNSAMPGLMFTHFGLQTPVVAPLFNTRQTGEVLLSLGKEVAGGTVFPWPSYQALIDERLKTVYDSGQGAIISEAADAEWLMFLKERGWRAQQFTTFQAFKKSFTESGGWWNPLLIPMRQDEMYQTPSGKFEFISSVMTQKVEAAIQDSAGDPAEALEARLRANHVTLRGKNLQIPNHQALHGGGSLEEFPLKLVVSQLLTNRDGRGATQPSLLEVIGLQVSRYWQTWVDVNPATGRQYGLSDHGTVWVESSVGRIEAHVRFTEGIHPGVLHIPRGLGHTHYGRYGTGIGSNTAEVIENRFDALTGAPALNGTPVKIYPAGREA